MINGSLCGGGRRIDAEDGSIFAGHGVMLPFPISDGSQLPL
jgi:hypothetical protein